MERLNWRSLQSELKTIMSGTFNWFLTRTCSSKQLDLDREHMYP